MKKSAALSKLAFHLVLQSWGTAASRAASRKSYFISGILTIPLAYLVARTIRNLRVFECMA
jgi:hypothetical protein